MFIPSGKSLRRLVALSVALASLATLAGCAGFRVNTDYDPGADFSSFRTYAWLPPQPGPLDRRLHNDLVDARIRLAMESALAERGFDQAQSQKADFLITYYLGIESRINVQTVHHTWGYSRRGWSGGVSTRTHVDQYEQGTLMIDVLEPSTRRLVWRGSTDARIRQRSDPVSRQARISDAVEAIMKRFPPS